MPCCLLVPSHYLNQCWNIVNWILANKIQWNFFIEKNGSLEMNKYLHLTFYNGCDYLSMLGLKLIHVSKRGPSSLHPKVIVTCITLYNWRLQSTPQHSCGFSCIMHCTLCVFHAQLWCEPLLSQSWDTSSAKSVWYICRTQLGQHCDCRWPGT